MRYILVQVTGQQGILIMEQQQISGEDVYVLFATSPDVERAAKIRDAMSE